jgi:exonuclease SbcC
VFIEFPDGVTGVVGLNGVGKSTVFEALAWALYGPVAARTSTDQIKREGAAPSDPCRVEMEFIFDDETYRVVREMSGKNLSASAVATINGKVAVNGAEVLSKFIQKKLGMDWKSFYTSIFAKQKELNALSSMNPSERRQLILRMLGINAVDDIITEIRSDVKNKKNMVEKLGMDLVDEHGESKIVVYQQQIKNLEKEQKERARYIEEQKKHLLKIREELTKLKKEYETKKIDYEKLCVTKEQLEEKKSRFEKRKRLEEEIKTLEKTIKERSSSLEKQKEKLTVFKTLEKDLGTLEQQQEKNNDSMETVVKKREQNTTIIHRLNDDIKELTTKKQHIEKMGPQAKCPTCERVLGEQYNTLLKSYLQDLMKKNNEMQTLTEEGKHLETDYERASREKQALQKKNTYLRSQEMEREKLQATLRHAAEEIKREERDLENKKRELKTMGLVEFDEKQYMAIRTKINDAYKSYQASLSKLDTIKEKHQELTIEQKEQEGEKNLITQQIKNYENSIEEQQKLAQKLENEQKDAQRLGMLTELMDSYRTYLISQIRPALSHYASELFDELTDGKYSEIELDEDYNLLVYDQGSPYSIERFSGGEEDLANLCIRLAISEIITERAGSIFNFIVLDEIFGSQDHIRKQNIIKALNNFSSKFRQVFLITHVEDIKHFTEHTITVSEDDNGISTIKIE